LRIDWKTTAQAFIGLMQSAIPFAVLFGGFVSLCYLAIEPWGRRELARVMTSWSRVLAGRWRDPLVGRDILIGVVMGLSMGLLARLAEFTVVRQGGPPVQTPWFPNLSFYLNSLMGPFSAVKVIVESVWEAVGDALSFFALLVLLTVMLRNKWLAIAALATFITLTGPELNDWIAISLRALGALTIVLVMLRFGLLANVISNCVFGITTQTFLTTEFSKWYEASSLVALIAVASLALLGFRLSLLRPEPHFPSRSSRLVRSHAL
jgi:serine/threonine-protein kinase